MPGRGPASYTTLAILDFVAGGFAMLCAVCGGIAYTMTVNSRDITRELTEFIDQSLPGYSTIKILGMIVGLLVGVGLIVAGIGLLQPGQWGRWLAVACSCVGALHHLIFIVLQLAYVNPAVSRFFERQDPFNASVLPRTMGLASVIGWGAVLVFFVAQIIVLSIQAPIARGIAADDEDWDDRPRRRTRQSDDYEDRPRRRRRQPADWDDDEPE